MKAAVKTGILAVLIILSTGIAAAFDFGAELTNTGGLRYAEETSWYTDHKSTLWLTVPLGSGTSNSLALEGSAYASKPADETSFKFFADLDLLRLSLVPVSRPQFRLSLDAGRFPAADITGLVLNQSVDGAEFHTSLPFGNLDFLAAYTGLLNIRKSGSLMSADDYADADAAMDRAYVFGPARAVGKLTFQVPQAIGNTDLIFEALGQYDLRRFIKTGYGETVDTVYATVSLSGPVFAALYYSVSGTAQAGILDADSLYSETSALASLRFDLYPAAGHLLFAQALFSPGDSEYITGFLPVTFQSAGTMYPGGYDNLVRLSAGWQYNPFAFLNADIGAKTFIHPTEPSADAGLYDSTEVTAGATVKATTDLRFRLDSAVLFPAGEDFRYQASLKAILDL